MNIIDISKELFSTPVYPGDPVPLSGKILSIAEGDVCNLSLLSIGSHSGTHIDAPRHFIKNGKDVSEMAVEKCLGECYLLEQTGEVLVSEIEKIALKGYRRLLIKGDATITIQAAQKMKDLGLVCIGVEKMTVGTPNESAEVHSILLGAEIAIIENLDMRNIQEGNYYLIALPLKLGDTDGSPCRAILLDRNIEN